MGIDESLFSVDQAEEIKTQNNLHIVPNATDSLLNKWGKATQRKIFNNLSDWNEDVFFELFDEKGNPINWLDIDEETNEETD